MFLIVFLNALVPSLEFLDKQSEQEYKLNSFQQTLFSNLRKKHRSMASWREIDEIFLVGVVMSEWYKRRSFKPTKADMERYAKQNLNPTKLPWIWRIDIYEKHKTACCRHKLVTGEEVQLRTPLALEKHWRQMVHNSQLAEGDCDCGCQSKTRKLERLWEEHYNLECRLTCSDERF